MSRRFVVHPARLLVAPSIRVVTRDDHRATIAVDGLVCSWCAARTQTVLNAMPGVRSVEIDLERGTAEVSYQASMEADERALQSALERVVLAQWARRFMERVARGLRPVRGHSR